MAASVAATREGPPEDALRPRAYARPAREVVAACARAADERGDLVLAEADPSRGTVSCWVRLLPLARRPGGPRKWWRAAGLGWWRRFDPALACGFLQVRVDPGPGGTAVVRAELRLDLPLAGPLAAHKLKGYLRWLDLRLGEPRRP